MRRLIFIQLFLLWTISSFAFAGDIRPALQELTQSMSYENCVVNMNQIASLLDNVKTADYQDEIKKAGHETLLDELMNFKVTIHNKLRSFHLENGLEKACADAARSALRTIRTTEDYVTESYYREAKDSMPFPDNSFDDGNLHVRRNPEFSNFSLKRDLQSGDILLTRGNAYTSAAIASLGEFDTQFSHMSMVYRDPEGKLWTVEAHIEVGSFVRPLQDHIDDKNYRTMVFRYDDAEVAHKAAEYIFNKVKQASDTTGNIRYDFGFDQDDNQELFCSEIISYAYAHVTEGALQIPLYRSQLMTRKPEFVKQLEIKAEKSFIPADIEVDPRFKLISEWRDAAKTQENLQKDAVLHAMFKWSDEYGYRMIQASSKKSLLYRNIAWPLRRVPFLKRYFKDKMPLNMSRRLIGYFGVLDSIGELLQEKLKVEDNKSVETKGIPMLKDEKAQFLESIRLEDLQTRKKKLHKMYRPVSK